jgi:hypothetical protein
MADRRSQRQRNEPDSQGAAVRVSPDAQHAGDLNPDSPHDFLSVNQQIFGNLAGTGQPAMQGFVKAYEGRTKNVQKSHNVMKCFGPGRLPNLQTPEWEKFALTERDRHANTFENCLNLSSARPGKVKFPKATEIPMSSFALSAEAYTVETSPADGSTGPLSEFQQAMVFQAVMADRLLPGDLAAAHVTSMSDESDAAQYLEQIRNCIEASRNGAARKTGARKRAAKPRKASRTKTTKKKATKKR